ncbi:hypothetical protein SLVCU150_1734 [Staphylococcus lugdunensis VCU150]|nr:hypothetical protein SEVCU139_1116 [Staphylococcus lugdunensis VCU139]KAK56850.1 hypothetical protein SLVCU150_1734 [Staphylococcus lugdunensis VCU150]KAK58724.1 hypothetical protein SLVCU148_1124 [Staphylococcus lugdunensis VCU148]
MPHLISLHIIMFALTFFNQKLSKTVKNNHNSQFCHKNHFLIICSHIKIKTAKCF